MLSNFRKLWEEGIAKLAAVYVLCLFGYIIWVGLLISWLFFHGVLAASHERMSMPEPKFTDELHRMETEYEPLLPIEKKLIWITFGAGVCCWSFGAGQPRVSVVRQPRLHDVRPQSWKESALREIGKVYLVGAGPGDPELLTVRAARLLRSGDVIVYDRLIQEAVLALAKPSAEKIYMGKPLGKHDSRQDEIHELLVRKAREGKTVIRLKGGDPFLFGRGGEEVEYLAEHGVPFEVVPGVSSCLSAPLSANIAVTHREASSSVAIVSGHNAIGNHERMDWQALSKIDTVVFLMCVHNVETIAQKLIAAGRPAGTPAAMIQMAYWDGELVVSGTLETIADEVRRAGVEPPATLVVGEVVRLRDRLKNLMASSSEKCECKEGVFL